MVFTNKICSIETIVYLKHTDWLYGERKVRKTWN